jgi:hypothetical protein
MRSGSAANLIQLRLIELSVLLGHFGRRGRLVVGAAAHRSKLLRLNEFSENGL